MTALNSQVKKKEAYIQPSLFKRLHYGSFSVAEVQPKYRRKLKPDEMPTVDLLQKSFCVTIRDLSKISYLREDKYEIRPIPAII